MLESSNRGYIIAIDQSTQGTKALLLDENARLVAREDMPHEQKVSKEGYVSHDPIEIYQNTLTVIKTLIKKTKINKKQIKAMGISNQRETTVAWNKQTQKPVCDAIVWQCARASEMCKDIEKTIGEEGKEYILQNTGIPLSPYFPAAKMSWILKKYEEAQSLMEQNKLCMGTIDSWLLYCLTGGKVFKSEYANASRTQIFNLHTLKWDETISKFFGIHTQCLPEICDSNSVFGTTTLEGYFEEEVPISAMLGDSHSALFGQGCYEKGMIKATYGTGSSLMMNVGDQFVKSNHGLISSLGWGINGKVTYVLEGNINYTGAVITWLKECGIITSPKETQQLAMAANKEDTTYLVPAFSGIGAPYWKCDVKALMYGMGRTTGRAEIVKAALECIGYQIADLLDAMGKDAKMKIETLRVDGGPTVNAYLMQFQSDIANTKVQVPNVEELSGLGVAYMAGMRIGLYSQQETISQLTYNSYAPQMAEDLRRKLMIGWKNAVQKC